MNSFRGKMLTVMTPSTSNLSRFWLCKPEEVGSP